MFNVPENIESAVLEVSIAIGGEQVNLFNQILAFRFDFVGFMIPQAEEWQRPEENAAK